MEHLFKRIVPLSSPQDRSRSMSELLTDPDYSKRFLLGLRNVYSDPWMEGVSIVTCTNKPHFRRNLFLNYRNQSWKKRELIIILNKDDMDIKEWREMGNSYDNVSIYQMPQNKSLGYCYNFAAEKARYDYIATFDDDDHYAPNYITDLMHAFRYTDADIVGKLAYYLYFKSNHILAIRNHTEEYKYLDAESFLDGGKKIVRRKVFEKVRYRDISNCEDVYFSTDSMKQGFKLFSTDKYNLVYLRRMSKANHTWKVKDRSLLKLCSVVKKTIDYKNIVSI